MSDAAKTPVWTAELYSAHSEHHRDYDDVFLRGLEPSSDSRVLDLGCGSGELTRRIAHLVPEGIVVGIDASPSMVEFAQRAQADAIVEYRRAQAQQFADVVSEWAPFDVVLSRATLHWVPKQQQADVLSQVRDVLRPAGALRIDMGGFGQLVATRRILDEESAARGGVTDPWYFPDVEEYAGLLETYGFSIEHGWLQLIPQGRRMPDFATVEGWMRSQIFIAYDPHLASEDVSAFHEAVLARAQTELLLDDGSYDQDYVRLDLLAHRA
jgi:trans-aconitate methyltransferase